MQYGVYIHGNPAGQDISGPEPDREYIRGLYSRERCDAEAYMQIERYHGKWFYTYVRGRLTDREGRQGAYFAITVSIRDAALRSVSSLYSLLDQIYGRLASDMFAGSGDTPPRYRIGRFSEGGQGSPEARIKKMMDTNMPLILSDISMTSKVTQDTYGKTKKRFSLEDVDSPVFEKTAGEYPVIVDPDRPSASSLCGELDRKLADADSVRQTLEASNAALRQENGTLTDDNRRLREEIRQQRISASGRRDAEMEQLRSELEKSRRECGKLRQDMEAARESVNQMDMPFKELSRRLAGRFPETGGKDTGDRGKPLSPDSPETKREIRNAWNRNIPYSGVVNTVMLCVLLVVALLTWHKVGHIPDRGPVSGQVETAAGTSAAGSGGDGAASGAVSDNPAGSGTSAGQDMDGESSAGSYVYYSGYDAGPSECRINVSPDPVRNDKGEFIGLYRGKRYTLSARDDKGRPLKGKWNAVDMQYQKNCMSRDGKGDSLEIPSDIDSGTEIHVTFIPDDTSGNVIKRTLYVQ